MGRRGMFIGFLVLMQERRMCESVYESDLFSLNIVSEIL